MADDLVSRFSSTLDEIERVAKVASLRRDVKPGWHRTTANWSPYLEGGDDGWAIESQDAEIGFVVGRENIARHIALWDPQAVLRLVAAMRT